MLRHFDIGTVFDVGANVGQYGKLLRSGGYKGRIVSFEPLKEAHRELSRVAEADPLWTVHSRCAVGDREGEVSINVAGNSVSSSMRAMLPAHFDVVPESKYSSTEIVQMITLDSVYRGYVAEGERVWLKVDTQGFEREVLQGAAELRHLARVIQLELSLIPLYEGQELWDHLLSRMRSDGYDVWALIPGFADARTGRTLQVDAVFAKV